jgi:hypothetical protein
LPQLHLYVPEDVAEELRRRAEAEGLSTSRYLARLVSREVAEGFPEDWFDRVAGKWVGDLERAPSGPLKRREAW